MKLIELNTGNTAISVDHDIGGKFSSTDMIPEIEIGKILHKHKVDHAASN